MNRISLEVPATTATKLELLRWRAADGAFVSRNEAICEVEAWDERLGPGPVASVALPSPVYGVLRQSVSAGTELQIGQVLGWIETEIDQSSEW